VPKTVLVDNQKAAVLSHQARSKSVFNEGFLQLAATMALRSMTAVRSACAPGPATDAVAADQRPLRQFQQTQTDRFKDE